MTRAIPIVLCLLVFVAASLPAQQPDLIVVVAIDQFPYQYITRFAPYFGEDGFNRFLKRGANFPNALYPYATTHTGPGHAAIGTGNVPARSGIVANSWFDRSTHAPEYAAADARATPPLSPISLSSDALGDRIQEKFPGAKVLAVAIKDRAAILVAGRKATAAYWFDPNGPGFTSSTYYRGANRELLANYNGTVPEYVAAHTVWEQSAFIPAADLVKLTHDPERLRQYKTNRAGLGVSFPHPIKSADALMYTPFGNGLVIGLAEQLVRREIIGTADGTPDLLFISLSSPDYLGHNYGPDSLEVADSVVRTDRDLQSLFRFLDSWAGDRYVLALTADHGVQSIPEVARDLGRDAGRITLRNPSKDVRTLADLSSFAPERAKLERGAAKRLALTVADGTPIGKLLIEFFEEPSVYLNWARIAELNLDGERVKRAMRDAALALKGVSGAFTNTELMVTKSDPPPLEAAVRRSFRADRSGDIVITLKPGYGWEYGSGTGAKHGQPVEADQHVPLMLWGAGVRRGSYDIAAAPTDLAISLGRLVGVGAGGPESRVLPCIVASPTADEVRGAIEAVLALLPAKFDVLVAGEHLDPRVRALIAPQRKMISLADVPQTEEESLPHGYVRLDKVDVRGDQATLAFWAGPVPKGKPGTVLLDCGTGYTYQLTRGADGKWKVASVGMSQC